MIVLDCFALIESHDHDCPFQTSQATQSLPHHTPGGASKAARLHVPGQQLVQGASGGSLLSRQDLRTPGIQLLIVLADL